MDTLTQFQERLFTLRPENFAEHALALFRWQAAHNEVYQSYLGHLRIDPQSVHQLSQIPFLPIDFFKRHRVLSVTDRPIETMFESSGTTGQPPQSSLCAIALVLSSGVSAYLRGAVWVIVFVPYFCPATVVFGARKCFAGKYGRSFHPAVGVGLLRVLPGRLRKTGTNALRRPRDGAPGVAGGGHLCVAAVGRNLPRPTCNR